MANRLARLPLLRKPPYCVRGFNSAYMAYTLQERMVELMTATGWTVGEIARIAGVTSAAVSQWVGNGAGKQSKSIGNAEAALRLEKASGFSWIWLAQGKGQKLAATADSNLGNEADQIAQALEVLTKALAKVDPFTQDLVRHSLSRLGQNPSEMGNISQKIADLLVASVARSGAAHDAPARHISGELGSLYLGGNQDGQRDRAAAPGSSKRR